MLYVLYTAAQDLVSELGKKREASRRFFLATIFATRACSDVANLT